MNDEAHRPPAGPATLLADLREISSDAIEPFPQLLDGARVLRREGPHHAGLGACHDELGAGYQKHRSDDHRELEITADSRS